MIRTLVEEKQTMVSTDKYLPSKRENANNQNWKGNNKKFKQTYIWCCGSVVDGVKYKAAAMVWNQDYGIVLVIGYGAVGSRVCDQNQKILKLIISFSFSQL